MTALKRQFFLSFAVIGSVMPLMTVFLREQGGFDFLLLGIASALMGVPMLFSPALLTLLADRNVDSRRILSISYFFSGIVLTGIYFSSHIAVTLILYFFHGLAFVAMLPLQDGFFFSLTEQHRNEGKKVIDYPYMRVWGTVGFILPSLLLFIPLRNGASPSAILPLAVGFCFLSLINSLTLPKLNQPVRPADQKGKAPTWKALQRLFSPEGRWLAISLFFGLAGATSYYSFVANYYDEVVHIPRQYIGLILNLGVLLEIAYSLLMPWMQRKIGLKTIMSLGFGLMAIRLLLVAAFPTPAVVLVTQAVTGLEVLALFLAPPIFLNRLAGDEFRNSIQGVYTMTVAGLSRVFAGLSAGFVVMYLGLKPGLIFGAISATIAFFVVTFLFGRIPPRERHGAT